jgi:voltage-gated potassium channel
VIEASKDGDKLSSIYDSFILITVIVSLVPLAFKEQTPLFSAIDKITVTIFIIDYILRWITADYKLDRKEPTAFIKYPFTPMAIVDLLSILPSITMMSSAFKVFRVFRMLKVMRVFRTMRVFRVFKAARYSKSMEIIGNVIRNSTSALAAVGTLAVLYVLVSALIVFNVEPDTFGDFFEAIYWATVSLTTVGYGDIYPVTAVGKFVAMVSSVFGIAIVALPAGIITAGYMEELTKEHDK